MKCHTPDCIGEHEAREISHSVVYRQRTLVVHHVPAHVCPDCGDAVLTEETTLYLEGFLKRKARAKGDAFMYEV
jgi:YgiT-type zinc finger domain-containing protein